MFAERRNKEKAGMATGVMDGWEGVSGKAEAVVCIKDTVGPVNYKDS